MRPRLGFSPTSPHHPAGSRTEPPMSVPTWSGRALARAFRPSLGGGSGVDARSVRIVRIERLEMWLPARDVSLDGGEDFRRGQRLCTIALKQFDGAQVMDFGH